MIGLNELIAQGADVNDQHDFDGSIPLHYTCMYNHLNIVNDLIISGAEVNKTNNMGDTPLHYASIYGHLETMMILLAASAEINKTTNNGHTHLHYASSII